MYKPKKKLQKIDECPVCRVTLTETNLFYGVCIKGHDIRKKVTPDNKDKKK